MKKEAILISLVIIITLTLLLFLVKADSQLFIPSGGDNQFVVGGSVEDSQFSFAGIHITPIPSTTNTVTPSGGGTSGVVGGGVLGPSGGSITAQNLTIVPGFINVNLALGYKFEQQISVTNIGNSTLNVSITQENLTQLVLIRNSTISLNPGETKNLSLAFIDNNKTGLFTGDIIIGGNKVPVSLNIMNQSLLFDVSANILNLDSKVTRWGRLKTDITMIPQGTNERLDVKLNYLILDSKGNAYLNKTESVLVDSNKTISRDFGLGSLTEGNYIFRVNLIYPGGIASADSHFEVTKATIIGEILYYALIALVASSAIVIVVLIARPRNKKPTKPKTMQHISAYPNS